MSDNGSQRSMWRHFWCKAHNLVVKIEPWGILFAVLALILSLGQVWTDYEDRVNQRVVRAWASVTTAAPGNSGKREALEYLNSEDGMLCLERLWGGCAVTMKLRTKLVGIDLSVGKGQSGAFLESIILPNANLAGSNLSKARLSKADLSNADLKDVDFTDTDLSEAALVEANLSGSNLIQADLIDADLTKADLSHAFVYNSDLSGTKLTGTNLTGATFKEVEGLTQEQLDTACAAPDGMPQLPSRLNWGTRPCQ